MNSLRHEACSIPTDDNELIITGGYPTNSDYVASTVDVYNINGWVRDLPSLNDRRRNHACGKFKSQSGDTVRNTCISDVNVFH